jgi:hypothetical protein
MKVAYLCAPHLGGTFSVYRHLRDGLTPHGHDLRWIGVGARAGAAWRDDAWAAERPFGFVVDGGDDAAQGAALIELIEAEGFDAVVVNVLTSAVEMNAVRYLDPQIGRIMMVHNITPGTYAAAAALRDFVHATVGVAPRIKQDLVRRFGFDPTWTFDVPHGIAVPADVPVRKDASGTLRAIYVGRIEDAAKGVFWLPRIMARVAPSIRLTVVGDGPDLAALRARATNLGIRVICVGPMMPERVTALLADHDAFLMPSRYEGFGYTLIEAMAQGCVPVAACIKGVTDAIVTAGHDGYLFPVGDVAAAAARLEALAASPAGRARLAANAWSTVRRRFSLSAMADGHAAVLARVADARRSVACASRFDPWRLPSGMRPGLRTFVPTPLKNCLRVLRERMAT